jgi:hypothetical protein
MTISRVEDDLRVNTLEATTAVITAGVNTYQLLNTETGSPLWVKLGTWVGGGVGSMITLRVFNGPGYNTGKDDQTITTITSRIANNTIAPNLAGVSFSAFGGTRVNGFALDQVKFVATGNSTSISNRSWDIWIHIANFSHGYFEISTTNNISYGLDSFAADGVTTGADPGVAAYIVAATAGNYSGLGILSWNDDTGLSRDAAGVIDVGNGTQGGKSGSVNAALFDCGASAGISSGLRLYDAGATLRLGFGINDSELQSFVPVSNHWTWNTGGDLQASGTNEILRLDASQNLSFKGVGGAISWNADTGLSRDAAGVIDVGNGTAGDFSGGLRSAGIAKVNLTAQSAAIATTTLYAVPASGAGQYTLQWNAKVTTAAGVSSTLGALTIAYTDPDGVVQTITCAAQSKTGTIETTDAGNSTTTVLLGLPILINAKASTNITYAFAYASNAANAMNYNLHLKLNAC